MDKKLIDAVSRAICGKRCLRQSLGIDLGGCTNDDGSNGICRAYSVQFLLSGLESQAKAAITAHLKHLADNGVSIVKQEDLNEVLGVAISTMRVLIEISPSTIDHVWRANLSELETLVSACESLQSVMPHYYESHAATIPKLRLVIDNASQEGED